ncbi:MAG: hypothetical protein V3V10_09270, partial [Planctomycetota bacterium]
RVKGAGGPEAKKQDEECINSGTKRMSSENIENAKGCVNECSPFEPSDGKEPKSTAPEVENE